LIERLVEQVHSEMSSGESAAALNVSDLLNECADSAAAMGAARSIKVVRSIPAELSCHIPAHRLRSVITDLLSNAIDYNAPGGKVEISCLHDGSQLRIRIGDSGAGIAEKDRPRLFQPFDRVDREADPQHLGLGLFLVQS